MLPIITPKAASEADKMFGEDWIEIELTGDTFDGLKRLRSMTVETGNGLSIPPFDDYRIIGDRNRLASRNPGRTIQWV